MLNTPVKKLTVSLIIVSMLLALLPSTSFAVTQDDIDAAQSKVDEIAEKREQQEELVAELESREADLLEIKVALEGRVVYNQELIDANLAQINLYSQMIYEKSLEVDEAKRIETEQLEKYRARVRSMEERGTYDIVGLILSISSLSDLLTIIDDYSDVMQSDKQLEDEYIAAREHTEAVKAEYEDVKADLEVKQAQLEEQARELQAEIDETNLKIEDIMKQIEEAGDELEEIQELMDEAQSEVNALTEQYEAEKAAALAAQQAAQAASGSTESYTVYVTGSGMFQWPVPSCTIITSVFGYRIHPIYGDERFHSGVDIGAQYGAAIVAADSGTVCVCGWVGGYGNCIRIDHGNGYYTLYGHMDSMCTSYGATVNKGDVIGYVGSTGNSTGPHLHFEICSGGVYGYTDPLAYYSGISFTYYD